MTQLTTSFRNMTVRDTINALTGLLYACRHTGLTGMNDQQRRQEMRHLTFGMGLLALAGIERSVGAATAAIGTMGKPLAHLANAGSQTRKAMGTRDWGLIVAGKLASACLAAMMSVSPAQAAYMSNTPDTTKAPIVQQAEPHKKIIPILRM